MKKQCRQNPPVRAIRWVVAGVVAGAVCAVNAETFIYQSTGTGGAWATNGAWDKAGYPGDGVSGVNDTANINLPAGNDYMVLLGQTLSGATASPLSTRKE